MKNPINKRIFRQITFYPARFIPIFAIIILVVVFSASFFTAQDSIKGIYDKEMKVSKIEDGQFTTIDILNNNLKNKLEKRNNIEIYENFSKEVSESKYKQIRIFINRKNINKTQILKGSIPKNENEIAISANYAKVNSIKVNDEIKLDGKTFKIAGLVALPDYSSLLRNREDLVMDTGYYGIGVVTKTGFYRFDKAPTKCTYSYHNKDYQSKNQSEEKLRNIVKLINKENFAIDFVTRDNNHNISYVMDDMDGDVPTMVGFMIILFLALAFVSAVEIKSLIEKEAPIIGTLLASGYRKSELFRNYMAMPLFSTLSAAIIGNIISYTYVYKKYVVLYYNSFDLPKFEARLTLRSFLITTIIPIFIYLFINSIVIIRSLRFTPLDFLRGNLRGEKKKKKISLKSLKFLNKFRLRTAFANKANIVALLIGVLLANLLLVISLSIKPAFVEYTKKVEDTMKYSHTYFVKAEQEGIKADKATSLNVELMKSDKKARIYGVDKKSAYKIKNYDDMRDNEVIISEGIAGEFSYRKGDIIKIREPFKNRELSLKIKSIEKDNSLFQILTTREILNKKIDKDKNFFNTYLSNEKLNISKDNLITAIDKEKVTKFTEHFLNNFGVVFEIIFVVGIIFYFIITMIISNIIMEKSRTNISYLKIFGFMDKEITKIYISPLFIFLVVLEFVTIPLSDKIIKKFMLVSLSKLDAYFVPDIPFEAYLKSILFSIFIFIVVQIYHRIRLLHIDNVKELKVING